MATKDGIFKCDWCLLAARPGRPGHLPRGWLTIMLRQRGTSAGLLGHVCTADDCRQRAGVPYPLPAIRVIPDEPQARRTFQPRGLLGPASVPAVGAEREPPPGAKR